MPTIGNTTSTLQINSLAKLTGLEHEDCGEKEYLIFSKDSRECLVEMTSELATTCTYLQITGHPQMFQMLPKVCPFCKVQKP